MAIVSVSYFHFNRVRPQNRIATTVFDLDLPATSAQKLQQIRQRDPDSDRRGVGISAFERRMH